MRTIRDDPEVQRRDALTDRLPPIPSGKKRRRRKSRVDPLIIGVDGEGRDVGEPPNERHVYTYLAAVDEYGNTVVDAHDPDGLSHEACAEMLTKIPTDALAFAFMFSYDATKILEDLPPEHRYKLVRPTARETLVCEDCKKEVPLRKTTCPRCDGTKLHRFTRPLKYGGRRYDFFNGSLTVSERAEEGGKKPKNHKVWDCFRFFGKSFVEALKDWKVASPEQIARIKVMKDQRGAAAWGTDAESVNAYCREECHLLAEMMRKVKDAHEAAGIPLERFDGVGSSASALLKANDVGAFKGMSIRDMVPGLAHAIACAFFGGRFEDSVVGLVKEPTRSYDISSAYPFALTHLPCLVCGKWRHEKKLTPERLREISARGGLVVAQHRVRSLPYDERKELAWAPLPCRDEKGSICYGLGFTGWAWAPELLVALRGWPDVVELTGEAWVYETPCLASHKPFVFVPDVYRKRCEWGKEGPGISLKGAVNACYGKCAQAIGDDPPFQSWVWAGMTTSTTRAQLLDAMLSAKDLWSILAVATDGILSLEQLPIGSPPRDTGTSDLAKPLGGWEEKERDDDPKTPYARNGYFIVKPGLYYRLRSPEEEREDEHETEEAKRARDKALAEIRARGVGRREVLGARRKLEQGFLAWDRRDPDYHVALVSRRFYGIKNSVIGRSGCETCGTTWPGMPGAGCPNERCSNKGEPGRFSTSFLKRKDGRDAYGTWGEREVHIAFDPHPKREREGLSRKGTYARLVLRDLGGIESSPYDVGTHRTTPEGEASREAREIELEQQDYDPELRDVIEGERMSDYEDGGWGGDLD